MPGPGRRKGGRFISQQSYPLWPSGATAVESLRVHTNRMNGGGFPSCFCQPSVIKMELELFGASASGNLSKVRKLSKKVINLDCSSSEDGKTALIWAAEGGHSEVAKLLLEHDASVDARDKDGKTALIWAAEGGHSEVAKLLVEQDASVDATDKHGKTALVYVAEKGYNAKDRTLLARLLVEHGASLDVVNEALMSAIGQGHTFLDQSSISSLLYSSMETLNENVVRNVATFLTPRDLMNFRCVSKTVYAMLPIEQHSMEITRGTWRKNGDPQRPLHGAAWKLQDINLAGISGYHIHGFVFECRWKDQGWGNSKGMVTIVKAGGRARDDYAPLTGDEVVFAPSYAPHKWGRLALSWSHCDPEQDYEIWVNVGGGGGHQLSLEDCRLKVLLWGGGGGEKRI